jgi:branched-chain amino acid aminotransferase
VTVAALPASWVNGVAVPPDAAAISVRDRGLTLADGVFETMRVHGGRIFRRQRHLVRLLAALGELQFPPIPDLDRWLTEATAALGSGDGSIRLTVTRGLASGGWVPPTDARPTVIVTVGPLPHFPAEIYERGLTARIAGDRRNEHTRMSTIKTVAYTDSVLALIEAHQAGADDALFLDTAGHCSEATASNLFVYSGGVLITPPTSCGALPGITRRTIMELGLTIGLEVAEREIDASDLIEADEAFLTSSLRGIAPLVSLHDMSEIGGGRPGALTARLRAAYTALVARECGVGT